MKNLKRSKERSVYQLLWPVCLLTFVFSLFPIAFSFMLSLGKYEGKYQFVGLDNYIRIFHDEFMWKSLINIVLIICVTIPAQLFLGLVLAVVLNNSWLKGRNAFRTIAYLPTITSAVAISFVFLTMFNPSGIINNCLAFFGIKAVDWLGNPVTARFAMMFVIIWKGLGYYVTLYLAALQNIPTDIYEAADLDGAGKVTKFFRLTVPQIKPVILYTLVMATMYGLNTFEIPNILFNGKPGPDAVAITVGQYMYDTAFKRFDFGTASAIGWMLVAICTVLAIIQFKVVADDD